MRIPSLPAPPKISLKRGNTKLIEVKSRKKEFEDERARRDAAAVNRCLAMGGDAKEAKDIILMRKLERLEEERKIKKEMAAKAKEGAPAGATAKLAKGLGAGLSGIKGAGGKVASRIAQRPNQMDLASVAIPVQLRAKRQALRWRPKWEFYLRLALAWAFQAGVVAIGCFYSILVAASFGNRETTAMVISWLMAYGWTFAIVEPVQVLILAGAPCLFDESHRIGRCCVRIRTVYNELCAP